MKTRVMSVILAALLILALIPSTAFAEEPAAGSPEPTVQTPAPDTEAPDADTETPDPDAGTPDPDTETPDPDAGAPDADTETPDPDAGTPDPDTEAPDPDAGTPAPDEKDEPKIPAPKTGLETPKAGLVTTASGTEGLMTTNAFWDKHNLTVNVTGQGTVSGWKKVLGVFVSTDVMGTNKFYENTEIKLQANEAFGWEFSNWTGDISGSDKTKTLTMSGPKNVTAVFTQRPLYTVTFVDWNDAVLNTQSVYRGYDATPPTNPTRAGYRFTGWDGSYDNIQTDGLVLKAQYVEQCTLSVHKVGEGSISPGLVEGTYDVGKTINLNRALPIAGWGWSFRGWKDDSTGSILGSSSVKLEQGGEVSYTAVFYDSEELKVRAGANGSLANNISGTYENGEQMNLTEKAGPTGNTGYVFDTWVEYGWNFIGYKGERGDTITIGDSNYFEARFKKAQYTVSFEENGSSDIANQTVEHGQKAVKPADPSLTGYLFGGWYADSGFGSMFDFDAAITGNTTIYLKWTPITYTVTYDGNDADSGSTPDSFHSYGTASALSSNGFSRTGHAFSGWAREEDGAKVYNNNDSVSDLTTVNNGTVTLYAVWAVNSYTVTYEDEAGVSLGTEIVSYGEDANAASLSLPAGSRIDDTTDWRTQLLNITDNKTVTVTLEYEVTFDLNGGTRKGGGALTQWVKYNGSATAPTVTPPEAFVFDKWDKAFGGVNTSISVKAEYKAYTFVVKADSRNVNGRIKATYGSDVRYLNPGQSTTFTAIVGQTLVWFQGEPNNGYAFDKWNGNPQTADNGLRSRIIYDMTQFTPYALFKAVEYDIEYVLNGGVNAAGNPSTYTIEDDEITLEDATRAGYNFLGWAEGDTIAAGSTGSKTFTAQWSAPIVYDIEYVLNGGVNAAGNPSTYTVEDDEITLADATRAGYNFLGWAEGDTIAAGSTGSKTFTAQWSAPIVYEITYALNGGTVTGGTNPTTYTVESTAITLINPARTGYAFVGWNGTDIADGTDTVVIPAGSTGNRSFTATYDINTYTVTFEDYDGTLLGTDRVSYGGSADAPDDPDREGYNFTGWDRDFDNVRANMTVTATYAIRTFTVTFEDFDGTVLSTDTVDWNTAATPPADPERDGYTFTGWDADFSAVTANMTVNAQYTENALIENEPVPQTGGNGDDDTVVLQDDGVPLQGPAAFPWWWILIGVGVAGLLFLLILFLVRRKKEEQGA